MHVLGTYVQVRARIIVKIKLVVDMYNDSLSFKLYEDPFIGGWEIAETKPSMHIYQWCLQPDLAGLR